MFVLPEVGRLQSVFFTWRNFLHEGVALARTDELDQAEKCLSYAGSYVGTWIAPHIVEKTRREVSYEFKRTSDLAGRRRSTEPRGTRVHSESGGFWGGDGGEWER